MSEDVGGTRALGQLFQRFFVVPGYQRTYDWGHQQVSDLLKDLHAHATRHRDKEIDDVPPYLLNSLLAVDHGTHLELIDGQQRITSLVLLFAAVRHHALAQHEVLLDRNWLDTTDRMIGQADGDDYRPRLMDQDETGPAQAFLASLADPAVSVTIDRLSPAFTLQRAYRQIREWLELHYPGDNPNTKLDLTWLLRVIHKRVRVAAVTVSTEAVAWQAFERANDRGRPLATADLVKSDLFNRATSDAERNAVAHAWRETLTVLRADEPVRPDLFLRHMALADLAESKISKASVRSELLRLMNAHTAEEAALHILAAARAYMNVRSGRRPNGSPCVPLLDLAEVPRFARFAQARPALLAARYLDDAYYDAVAAQLERLIVVVTLIEERGQDHEKDFFALTKEIRAHSDDEPGAVVDRVTDLVDGLMTRERMERFLDVLARAERTTIGPHPVKYLLWRVEGHLRQLANPGEVRQQGSLIVGNSVDVEHILPQSLPEAALDEFGASSDEGTRLLEALGNLTLWEKSPNSAAQDQPYSVKRSAYRSSRFKLTKATAGGLAPLGGDKRVEPLVTNWDTWTKEALEVRHVEVAQIAASLFLPGTPRVGRCLVSGDAVVPASIPTFPKAEHLPLAISAVNAGLRTSDEIVSRLPGVNTVGVANQVLAVLRYLDLVEQHDDGVWDLTTTGQLVCDESEDEWPYLIGRLLLADQTLATVAKQETAPGTRSHEKASSVRRALRWANQCAPDIQR